MDINDSQPNESNQRCQKGDQLCLEPFNTSTLHVIDMQPTTNSLYHWLKRKNTKKNVNIVH